MGCGIARAPHVTCDDIGWGLEMQQPYIEIVQYVVLDEVIDILLVQSGLSSYVRDTGDFAHHLRGQLFPLTTETYIYVKFNRKSRQDYMKNHTGNEILEKKKPC